MRPTLKLAALIAALLPAACVTNGTGGSATMAERMALANELAAEEFGHDEFRCEPEYLTGSKIPKIVCMTDAQRTARAEANKSSVDSYYNNSSGKACVDLC